MLSLEGGGWRVRWCVAVVGKIAGGVDGSWAWF